MSDFEKLLGDLRRMASSAEHWSKRVGDPGSPVRMQYRDDAAALRRALEILEKMKAGGLEDMAAAHDAEESAQKGEPSPWRTDLKRDFIREHGLPAWNDWRDERIAAMRAAVEALLA